MSKPKVVLAYSGGLDTSICIPWLMEEKGLEVIAFCADVGQKDELEPLDGKARATGAIDVHILDLRERLIEEYIWPALKAGAHYGDGYLLATAYSRPLIAAEMARIAEESGAEYVAHGCTGKGNDQVRIEAGIASLAPHLKIIAPLREWEFLTRDQEIEYAQERNIPVPVTKSSPYSYDRNLWGTAIECGVLEEPWNGCPEDAYLITKSPESAPDEALEIEVTFEKGIPVAVDGEAMSGFDIIEKLTEVGSVYGVGRTDYIEDRLVGIKSREVYESPAGEILTAAHKAIEALCLPKNVLEQQRVLSQEYGRLVYNGQWFCLEREAMDAYFNTTQVHVSGTARVRLYKGNVSVPGRKTDNGLYQKNLSTYDVGDTFDREASEGFVKLWSLPLRVEGERARK